MDIPIPKPILDVDNWFKSTFNFDGHGNINLSSRKEAYYYSIQNIIEKIGNSQGDNILKYIKESIDDCEVKQQDTLNCNYVFYKMVSGIATVYFTISERDFNKYCSRGAWHDRLKQHRRDDQVPVMRLLASPPVSLPPRLGERPPRKTQPASRQNQWPCSFSALV